MSKYTKQLIRETCLTLLEEKPFDKLTVKDIVTKCEMNRNTFYYYYADIFAVIEDIFENEKEKIRKREDSQISFLDAFHDMAQLFLQYRKAVLHLYNSRSQETIRHYIEEMANDFVWRFVRQRVEGKELSQEDLNFIVDFYSAGIIASTMKWIQKGVHEEETQLLLRMTDTFESTIDILIENCQNKKYGKN